MQKGIKAAVALALVVTVSACNRQEPVEEFVIIDVPPAPISVEPVHTGKYK